jgi:hypothetical protein
MLGCVSNPVNPLECVTDPCSLYIGRDECFERANERCIISESGCREVVSCSQYTGDLITWCGKNPECTIVAGACSSHPCPNSPPPDENYLCPSGCRLEEKMGLLFEYGETSSAILDMESNRKTNINSNSRNGVITPGIFEQQYMFPNVSVFEYLQEKGKHVTNARVCDNDDLKETIKSHVKMEIGYSHFILRESPDKCVVDTCVKYESSACLTHTEEKCIPTSEGCRCVIIIND